MPGEAGWLVRSARFTTVPFIQTCPAAEKPIKVRLAVPDPVRLQTFYWRSPQNGHFVALAGNGLRH